MKTLFPRGCDIKNHYKRSEDNSENDILNGITGSVNLGEVLALMGPLASEKDQTTAIPNYTLQAQHKLSHRPYM